jgi:hypothetical protein
MKLAGILPLLLWCSVSTAVHPLHLSITNITYENGKLGITMKTFLDDWETAYFHYHGDTIHFSDPVNRAIPWFSSYLERSFRISLEKDSDPFPLMMESMQLEGASTDPEGETLTISMTTSIPGEPKSLYIYNALLTDIYPDQTNLVIFGYRDRETGMKFDMKKQGDAVSLK